MDQVAVDVLRQARRVGGGEFRELQRTRRAEGVDAGAEVHRRPRSGETVAGIEVGARAMHPLDVARGVFATAFALSQNVPQTTDLEV
jgi:hypothetical protein